MQDDGRWTVQSSEVLIRDAWMTLWADRCLTQERGVVEPYYVQECPDWVSVVAVDSDHRLVLTREYHHAAAIVELGLPGGACEPSDTTPLAAAVREFQEEIGYLAGMWENLGTTWANWNSQTNKVHFFLARGCTPTGTLMPDENEDIDVELMPLTDFHAGLLPQSYHRLNALLALEHLRSGPDGSGIPGNPYLP
jgi:8-oxo-dGTP pyrophosphatase MutT (NUDIX family)